MSKCGSGKKGFLRKYTMGGFTGAGIAEAGTLAGNLLTASANTDPYGRNKMAVAGSTLGGAAQGFQMGAALGPLGMAAGAVVGGAMGFAEGQANQDAAKKLKLETEKQLRADNAQLKYNRAESFYAADPTYKFGNRYAQNFKFGGMLKKYNMGGQIQQDIAYDGPSHENGGIEVDQNGLPAEVTGQEPVSEVEGGETMKKDTDYVFSDSLSPEQGIVPKGKGNTFAKIHKKIIKSNKDLESKLDLNPFDVAARNTVLLNKMNADMLQQKQEQMRQELQMNNEIPMNKFGGKLKKYIHGGPHEGDPTNPFYRPPAVQNKMDQGNFIRKTDIPNTLTGEYTVNPPSVLNPPSISGPKSLTETSDNYNYANDMRSLVGKNNNLKLDQSLNKAKFKNYMQFDPTMPKVNFPPIPQASQELQNKWQADYEKNQGKIGLITKTDPLMSRPDVSRLGLKPNDYLNMAIKGKPGLGDQRQFSEDNRDGETASGEKKQNVSDFLNSAIDKFKSSTTTGTDGSNTSGTQGKKSIFGTRDQSQLSEDRIKQIMMVGNTAASFIDNAANASVIRSNMADLHPNQKFNRPVDAKLLDYSAQRAEADRQIRGFNQGLDQNVSSSTQGNRMKLGALAQNINAKNMVNQTEANANQQIKQQTEQMNAQIEQQNNAIDQQNRLNRWTQRREIAAQQGQNKAQIGQDLITANTNQQKLMEDERVNSAYQKYYDDQISTAKNQQKLGLYTSNPESVKAILGTYSKEDMMNNFNMSSEEYDKLNMMMNNPEAFKKFQEEQQKVLLTINNKGNVQSTNTSTGSTGYNIKQDKFGGFLKRYGR